MHYDPKRPKQFKAEKEVIDALRANPLSYNDLINMVNDGIVIQFIDLDSKGISLLVGGVWYIFVDNSVGLKEKEEIIWHELLHLHLRRIFGGFFNDNGPGSEGVHLIIIEEGKRLSENPSISYENLLTLIGR